MRPAVKSQASFECVMNEVVLCHIFLITRFI